MAYWLLPEKTDRVEASPARQWLRLTAIARRRIVGSTRDEFHEENVMNLRQKYDHAIQIAKSLRMQGAAEERDGKLYFNGVVNSEDEKNQIWNAIKTSSSWQQEVVGDIRVQAKAAAAPAAAPAP